MSHPHSPWLEVTTIFPCAVNCSYCPQDVLKASYKPAYKGDRLLSLERFKQVLKNVPTWVMIDFAGFGEPFLNPECADMILYAHEAGYKVEVKSTLVGFSDEIAQRIAHVPFGAFWFHDRKYDTNSKGSYYHAGNLPSCVTHVQSVSPDVLTARAGNLFKALRRETDATTMVCVKSDKNMVNVMLPNADVVLCCNDWALQHVLGNLLVTRFEDLSRADTYELCRFCNDWVPR